MRGASPMRSRHLRGVVAIEQQTSPPAVVEGPVRLGAEAGVVAGLRRRSARRLGRRASAVSCRRASRRTSPTSPSTRGIRRQGVATMLMLRLVAESQAWGLDAMTLEVRASNDGGAGAVPAVRLRARRRAPALLRRDGRGRHHHVGARHRPATPTAAPIDAHHRRADATGRLDPVTASPTPALGRRADPRHRDVVRRDRRRARRAAVARCCRSVVSSQVDLHARFGGVVPEIASRAHLELLIPVVAEAVVSSRCRRVTRSTRSPRPTAPA